MAVIQGRFMPSPTEVTANNIQDIAIDRNGKLLTSPGYEDDIILRVVPVASNGTTPVLLIAAVAGQTVYPVFLSVRNMGATNRVLELRSNVAIICDFIVPTGGGFVLDLRGSIRTDSGESLQFTLTDAAITDVFVSGSAVQR